MSSCFAEHWARQAKCIIKPNQDLMYLVKMVLFVSSTKPPEQDQRCRFLKRHAYLKQNSSIFLIVKLGVKTHTHIHIHFKNLLTELLPSANRSMGLVRLKATTDFVTQWCNLGFVSFIFNLKKQFSWIDRLTTILFSVGFYLDCFQMVHMPPQ